MGLIILHQNENFKNKNVLVVGLGSYGGGVGAVKFLCSKGANVTVTDLKTARELSSSLDLLDGFPVRYVLSEHREEDLEGIDFVVRNPAVPADSPFMKAVQSRGIPVEMESSLFFRFCPSTRIIGVTGTKGKTTTAALVFSMLKDAGEEVVIAGNMGISMLDSLSSISFSTCVVLELSSFQLEGLAFIEKSPRIAVITNIFPDHFDRYKSFDKYLSAKKNIVKYQRAGDFCVVERSLLERVDFLNGVKSKVVVSDDDLVFKVGNLLGIGRDVISKVVDAFPGLAHRMEKVVEKDGVVFYNDSCATNPHATVFSISRLGGRPVLITGGTDKGLDYRVLAEEINRKKIKTVLLKGSALEKISSLLEQGLVVGVFEELYGAVLAAKSAAGSAGVVLFSPASASFEMFKDEFDRGNQFKHIVSNL